MKIIPPVNSPDVATASARNTPNRAMQWRKALEDAQWQVRQRVARQQQGDGAVRESTQDAASESADTPARACDGANTSLPSNSGSTTTPVRADALAAGIARAVQSLASALEASSQALAAPASQQPLASEAAPARATQTQRAATPVLFELPEWPDSVVHATVQGNAISVGMRDGSVSEDDAVDLYHRLRTQLRRAGLELANLIVNGHEYNAPRD